MRIMVNKRMKVVVVTKDGLKRKDKPFGE